MKKSYIVLLHIGYWLLYLLLFLLMLEAVNQGKFPRHVVLYNSPISIMAFIPAFIGFYTFYFTLFDRYFYKQKKFPFFIGVVSTCLVSTFLCEGLLSIFFQPMWINAGILVSTGIFIFILTLIHGTIGVVIRGFIVSYNDIRLKEQLNKKNYEMELALVKSQLNPHFLFNTINNIDILIEKDSKKASLYLNKLSEMMRYMLYESKTEKVSLSKELTYIEKYIELQKIRTSNQNYINYSVIGSSDKIVIEPMLFIPFVENAFKHSENKTIDEAINIHFEIGENKITFKCSNRYTKITKSDLEDGGLGNELMIKRLTLLYPKNHTLQIVNDNELYSVTLVIMLA